MQVLELLAEDLLLIADAVSEEVWEDSSLFGLELVSIPNIFLQILANNIKQYSITAQIHFILCN